MAATDIERLTLRMEANMTQVERSLAKLNRDADTSSRRVAASYRQAGQQVEASFQRIGRTAQGVLGALGVAFSARALQGLIRDSLQTAETLQDLSRQINANVEGLQTLRYAVDQNGGSSRALDSGLRRLADGMGRVMTGQANQATRALDRLGLAQRIQRGEIQTTDQLYRELADAMQGVSSQQERAALASQIFGRELGVQLSQSLALGSSGLAEFEERMRASGIHTEEMVRQGAEANAKLREMGQIITRQLQGAVLENTPGLEAMAAAFADIATNAMRAAAAMAGFFDQRGLAARGQHEIAAEALEGLAGELARQIERGGRVSVSLQGSGVAEALSAAIGREAAQALLREFQADASMFGTHISGEPLQRLYQAVTDLAGQQRREAGRPAATPGAPGVSGSGGGAGGPAAIDTFPQLLDDVALILQSQANPALMANVDLLMHEIETRNKLALAEKTNLENLEDLTSEYERFNLTMDTVVFSGIKNLESAWVDFIATGQAGLSDLARSFLANLARMAFQQSIGNPLQRALGGVFGFGGGKAAGGTVSAGMAYRVGERGAETFVPNVSGMIVPNTERAMSAARPGPQEIRVRLMVEEGDMFASRVEAISSDVTRQHIPVSVEISRSAVAGDLAKRQSGRLGL